MRLETDLSWSPDSRTFTVKAKDSLPIALERAGGSVEVDGRPLALSGAAITGSGSEARGDVTRVELAWQEVGLSWQWELRRAEKMVEITARLRNTGAKELRIGKWNVLDLGSSGGRVRMGDDPGNLRFFGWHPWDMRVELMSSLEGKHSSHNLCHLTHPESGRTLLCGFVTVDRMQCAHTALYSPAGGIVDLRATCSFGSYPLAPGGEIASERLRITFHTDPYEALEEWAQTVSAAYGPVYRELPPVGWCGGGWIDAFSPREDCWEKVALDNARAIREKLKGFEVTYLWTSQTNLKNGLPGNWLTVEPRQIPSGLEGFFRAQRELGFTPALWVAPFWFYAEAEGMLEENQANLLRDAQGAPITETESWEFDIDADPDDRPRLHRYYLDGTHPGTVEFVRKVFSYYRSIGVRYYMLDFLGVKENARLHDPTQTPLQSARSILKVIREAAGEDTHLQTAVSSTPGFISLINAARVGRDFGEGRPLFPPYAAWRNAVYVLHDLHFGNTHYLVQNAAASWFTHRKTYINDFNLLTVDKPVPLPHAEIAVTVFGLGGGSPLMLGDDFRGIDAARLRMVKLCLPRTQKVPIPVDLFEHVYPGDSCRILKLAVETSWDSYLLVAVFNLGEEPYSTKLDFAALGLDVRTPHQVYEFWTEEYRGIYRGTHSVVVPPGACRLYRIARARAHPWLLSTDLHVQQGAVEVRSLAWDQASMRLGCTVCRPPGEVGNLFFLMPRKYRLINHEGTGLMKEVLDMNVVVRKQIRFDRECESFELEFEPVGTPYVSRRGWLPYAAETEWLEHVRKTRRSDDSRVVE